MSRVHYKKVMQEKHAKTTGISQEIVGIQTRFIKKTSFVRGRDRSAVVVAAEHLYPATIVYLRTTHIVDTCSNLLAVGRVIYLAHVYICYPFLSYSNVYVTLRSRDRFPRLTDSNEKILDIKKIKNLI